MTKFISSPLNYTGGKAKLLSQILPLFPEKINTFVDLFSGGCNVGINCSANHVIFNDVNNDVLSIFNVMKKIGTQSFLDMISDIILKYQLSESSIYGYEYYGCNSNDGLGKYNKSAFNTMRNDLNSMNVKSDSYYILLYVVIVYAFNNQIRFNSDGHYNLPVGKRDFNNSLREKFISFGDRLAEISCSFSNSSFEKFPFDTYGKEDFFYADPPYLITTASYNEQNGWTEKNEKDLLSYLDSLNEQHINFALSNVLCNKGKSNSILQEWLNERDYHVYHLKKSYANSNYHSLNRDKVTDEILVTNYENNVF